MVVMRLILNYWVVIQIMYSKCNTLLCIAYCLTDLDRTNYFWGHEVLYTVNGGFHEVPGGAVYDSLHTYTIDW